MSLCCAHFVCRLQGTQVDQLDPAGDRLLGHEALPKLIPEQVIVEYVMGGIVLLLPYLIKNLFISLVYIFLICEHTVKLQAHICLSPAMQAIMVAYHAQIYQASASAV
jgi:hypothetical protein